MVEAPRAARPVERQDLARILGIVAVGMKVQATRSGFLLDHVMFRDDVAD